MKIAVYTAIFGDKDELRSPFNYESSYGIKYYLFTDKKTEDVFLVELKVSPGNNLKVFLDADKGVTIDTCISINRALYKKIEEDDLFPNGDFSLEVSSPGVDEPLKLHRQYKKNIGRNVEVVMNDG